MNIKWTLENSEGNVSYGDFPQKQCTITQETTEKFTCIKIIKKKKHILLSQGHYEKKKKPPLGEKPLQCLSGICRTDQEFLRGENTESLIEEWIEEMTAHREAKLTEPPPWRTAQLTRKLHSTTDTPQTGNVWDWKSGGWCCGSVG